MSASHFGRLSSVEEKTDILSLELDSFFLQRVNLQLQFIQFLVILPFTFQLSLHLERGTHHAYKLCLGC